MPSQWSTALTDASATEGIEVGDMVLAEDPEIGERGPCRVSHVWVHDDQLVDLSIGGEVLTTTEDHPFWNVSDELWQAAEDLDFGDLVLTADGELVSVEGPRAFSERQGTAYNLTVEGIHTFFVEVGGDEVLVHNYCGELGEAVARGARVHSSFPDVVRDLAKNHGISKALASARLHAIKRREGLGGGDNVVFDRTGSVFDPTSGGYLGSLTQGGKQGFIP